MNSKPSPQKTDSDFFTLSQSNIQPDAKSIVNQANEIIESVYVDEVISALNEVLALTKHLNLPPRDENTTQFEYSLTV